MLCLGSECLHYQHGNQGRPYLNPYGIGCGADKIKDFI